MAIVTTDNKHYQAIADTLRNVIGTGETIYPSEMADKIVEGVSKAYADGIEKGKVEGGNTEEAYNEGFEAGKQAQEQAFWSAYQNQGGKTDYSRAFAVHYWTDKTFQPQYDFIAANMQQAFQASKITNLKQKLADRNLKFDTSQATSFVQAFQTTKVKNIPEIDLRNAVSYGLSYIFSSSEIVTIDNIILHDTYNLPNTVFDSASGLVEVRFTGKIRATLKISQSSKLSAASVRSAIRALENYSSTDNEGVNSLLLHAKAWTSVDDTTAEDYEAPPSEATWKDYVLSIGWQV